MRIGLRMELKFAVPRKLVDVPKPLVLPPASKLVRKTVIVPRITNAVPTVAVILVSVLMVLFNASPSRVA